MKAILTYAIVSMLLLFSCAKEDSKPAANSPAGDEAVREQGPLFKLLSADRTGITFQNNITESAEMNGLTWDAIYSGGGVGIGDINNDGLEDIYLAGNQVTDALYLNKGDLKFENISKSAGINSPAGWSGGVSMVDINADGYLDIYVCRNSWKKDNQDPQFRKNKLFINNGDLTFSEQSAKYGLDYGGYSTQAAFIDFDKDGDLDLFLLNTPSNNISQKVAYGQKNKIPDFASDQFYINDNGSFKNATKEVGVFALSYGLGVVVADLDHDTWPDIYVANDYERPDYMYINQKNGTFKNLLDKKIKHTSFTSMGCDAADINNDGLVDLAVVDMQSSDHIRSKTNMPSMDAVQFWSYVNQGYNYQFMSNTMQLNNGSGYFSDIAQYTGMSSSDWSWAVLIADYDNNRYKDSYITNGINKDLRDNDFKLRFEDINKKGEAVDLLKLSQELPSNPLPNHMYKNQGNFKFESAATAWGLDQKTFSFGAAYGDLDNDGDLDLVVNNNNERAYLYENQLNGTAHYLTVKIEGPNANPLGYGTKVFIYQNGEIQYQELNPVRGYQSSCSPRLHFGLDNNKNIDSLVCIFPDDKSIRKYKLTGDQRLSLNYDQATNQKMQVYSFEKKIFNSSGDQLGLEFSHVENAYDDWQEEILLPHAESRKGPYQAVGDVNGDGLDDFFIGGATGQAGQLMLQNKQGKFVKKPGPWSGHAAQEDMGCALFDADGDNDLDLYVASGGNASDDKKSYYDRLYRNDGAGNFTTTTKLIPQLATNSSCVEPSDFDGDGDMDLFIGGLVDYGRYPYPGQSVLLRNDGQRFSNVTNELAPTLGLIGMVTDACWADVNQDKKLDLVVVGEWMQPTAFINNGVGFEESKTWVNEGENLKGWWMSIESSDLNKDGKPDFIVGNFGTNNKYHPSIEKPLKVYSSDFDGNNTNDIVLAKNYKGTYVPVRGRECSSEQMPFVAEKYSTFSSFANASIENILEDKMADALQLEVREFKSGVILSGGSGYDFIAFPAQAQFAPVMASLIQDFNKDGILDILLAGNLFDAEVETTRHDASNGLYLKGMPNGKYEPYTILNSGFYAPFNTRTLALLKNNAGSYHTILVGANNSPLTAFAYQK